MKSLKSFIEMDMKTQKDDEKKGLSTTKENPEPMTPGKEDLSSPTKGSSTLEKLMISVHEASEITEFPRKKWFEWILDGLIPSSPELSRDNIKGMSYSKLSKLVMIPITALPRYYSTDLIKKKVLKDKIIHVDLIGFMDEVGEERYLSVMKEINLIREFIAITSTDDHSGTEKARIFAEEKGYSLATLYRKKELYMKSDLRKLLEPTKKIYHPKMMCRLSEDFAKFEWEKPNHLAKINIQRKLEQEARERGKDVCTKCPYNPKAKYNRHFVSKYPEMDFSCSKTGNGMLYPSSKDPFNRFLSTVGEQEKKFSREGANAWRDAFMHVTKRDKPEKTNEVWFGDHFLGDNRVICGYDKDNKPIIRRTWITCNYDAASGAVVGSTVCTTPNSRTIAECFCRSAAFTVDSPFFSLPEVYYVDRGADFRSTMLEGQNYDLRQRVDQHYYLNRAFCDNPLLPSLNVTVIHALPRSGRSKTVERLFGTITRKYLQEVPGWIGNCPKNRPFDAASEEKRLLEEGKLWTIEKYARYWIEVVIPAYNNTIPDGEKESPLDKYKRLEKADTAIPDWDTLSVFMEKKPSYKVRSRGIYYNNDIYWHPALSEEGIMGTYIRVYDFDQTFCHSISVIKDGKYICEAEPLIHQKVVEPDRLKLAQHLEEQKAQRRRISRRVTVVKETLKTAGVKAERYIDYEPEDDLPEDEEVRNTMYCETIDEERDKKETTILSNDANEIAKVARATMENIERIVNGPKDNAFENYYISKGRSITNEEE